MPVVSNTSPILNLAIIGQLDLLHQQFGEVLIPPVVLKELKVGTELAGADVIRSAINASWLRVLELKDDAVSRALKRELDTGEPEAIALSLQEGINRLLVDEHDVRVAARALGLKPIGLLAVLLFAKRTGRLDSVEETMRTPQKDAGFYVASDLFELLPRKAGEP